MKHRRRDALLLAVALCVSSAAWAAPVVGRAFPAFAVDDIGRTAHTQRDLLGRWTVILAMTDKDIGPAITAWYRRVEPLLPVGARTLTFAALDLFPLVPTATIMSEARGTSPRCRWGEVWLSRDGSLASSLGLVEDELPWVFVVDPSGRVVESIHANLTDAGLARVRAALSNARPQPGLPEACPTAARDAGVPR
ncbi:MAG: hypothetical protein U0326_26150 [Polyangiales bacterium]